MVCVMWRCVWCGVCGVKVCVVCVMWRYVSEVCRCEWCGGVSEVWRCVVWRYVSKLWRCECAYQMVSGCGCNQACW